MYRVIPREGGSDILTTVSRKISIIFSPSRGEKPGCSNCLVRGTTYQRCPEYRHRTSMYSKRYPKCIGAPSKPRDDRYPSVRSTGEMDHLFERFRIKFQIIFNFNLKTLRFVILSLILIYARNRSSFRKASNKISRRFQS